MKALKTLIFSSLILLFCLGTASAETCYSPNAGYYDCDPNYESYPYPYTDTAWGGDFFGVVIGGGGYYGGGYGGNWHGGHGGNWHGGHGGGPHGGGHGGGGHHHR